MVAYINFGSPCREKENLIKKGLNQEEIHFKQNVSFGIVVSVGIEASDFDEIHPSSCPFSMPQVKGMLESIPADFRQEVGYIMDRSPIHCNANTKTDN